MQIESLSKVVKTARTDLRYNQNRLAELVGVSDRYIRDIESGQKQPAYETLFFLITALGIDANEIFYPDTHPGEELETARLYQTLLRLLNQCNAYQLHILLATASAILHDPGHKSN